MVHFEMTLDELRTVDLSEYQSIEKINFLEVAACVNHASLYFQDRESEVI